MKQKITIYTDIKSDYFLKQLFSEYELIFRKVLDLNFTSQEFETSIIFLNDFSNFDNLNLDKIFNKYMMIAGFNISLPNNNFFFLRTPTSITNLRNQVKKFLSFKGIKFDDINLINRKLINMNNSKKYCFLTEIENEILLYLVNKRSCRKSLIKKDILNIKKDIETNSLDSHLSRIRKKLAKIESHLKIKTKNEILSISSN